MIVIEYSEIGETLMTQRKPGFWIGTTIAAIAVVAGIGYGAYSLGQQGNPTSPSSSNTPSVDSTRPSVIFDTPTEGQAIVGKDGAVVSGTVHDVGDDSIWVFDIAMSPTSGNTYYLSSDGPVAKSNSTFSVVDKPIGDGANDVGATFTIALVRATTGCSQALQAAKPNSNGAIAFDALPTGCRDVGRRQVKKIAP